MEDHLQKEEGGVEEHDRTLRPEMDPAKPTLLNNLSPPKNPVLEAETAMQQYLDQDDGGEAWLKVMGEIMDYEDSGEEKDFDTNTSLVNGEREGS